LQFIIAFYLPQLFCLICKFLKTQLYQGICRKKNAVRIFNFFLDFIRFAIYKISSIFYKFMIAFYLPQLFCLIWKFLKTQLYIRISVEKKKAVRIFNFGFYKICNLWLHFIFRSYSVMSAYFLKIQLYQGICGLKKGSENIIFFLDIL
jgi:ammonia channel protein AmtB